MEPTGRKALTLTGAAAVSVTIAAFGEEMAEVKLRSPDASYANGASGAVAPAMGYSSEPPYGRVDPSGEPPKFHINLRLEEP